MKIFFSAELLLDINQIEICWLVLHSQSTIMLTSQMLQLALCQGHENSTGNWSLQAADGAPA